MDFAHEESFISTRKTNFKSLFGKEADDNLNEFLMYLTDTTNRRLCSELEDFNKHIDNLKENGFFERLLEK
ncbi:MAG: hypothetical protein WD607_02230 [Candidatus Paceibacterota bacterium]